MRQATYKEKGKNLISRPFLTQVKFTQEIFQDIYLNSHIKHGIISGHHAVTLLLETCVKYTKVF